MLQFNSALTQKPYSIYPKAVLGEFVIYECKILVVEDEPAINELIAGTLDLSDFDVVQAYDTQRCLCGCGRRKT